MQKFSATVKLLDVKIDNREKDTHRMATEKEVT